MLFKINLEGSLVIFFNVLDFLLLASGKNGGYMFLILSYTLFSYTLAIRYFFIFLVINIYCFSDLLLFRLSWYMVTGLGIFLTICLSV